MPKVDEYKMVDFMNSGSTLFSKEVGGTIAFSLKF